MLRLVTAKNRKMIVLFIVLSLIIRGTIIYPCLNSLYLAGGYLRAIQRHSRYVTCMIDRVHQLPVAYIHFKACIAIQLDASAGSSISAMTGIAIGIKNAHYA